MSNSKKKKVEDQLKVITQSSDPLLSFFNEIQHKENTFELKNKELLNLESCEAFRKKSGDDISYENKLKVLEDGSSSSKKQKKKTKISHIIQSNTFESEGLGLLESLGATKPLPSPLAPNKKFQTQPKAQGETQLLDPNASIERKHFQSENLEELVDIVKKSLGNNVVALRMLENIKTIADEAVRDSTQTQKQLAYLEKFTGSYSLSASRNTDQQNNSNNFDSMMNMLEDIYLSEDVHNSVKLHNNFKESHLHFCLMFASPLVIFKKSMGMPVLKPIPYEIEYNNDLKCIKKVLKSVDCNIGFISSRASNYDFVEVLKKNPMMLHFCGHGIDYSRTKRMHSNNEENLEDYYLLFEDRFMRGELVDCEKLKSMLDSAYKLGPVDRKNKLEFVFVASCHSEILAKVFLTAGASHVLCVNKDDKISDDICQEFSELYYRAFFSENLTFCEAFESAKQKIAAGMFYNGEENKFKMLLQKPVGGPHRCTRFIFKPNQEGKFTDFTPVPAFVPPFFNHDCFVGRNKELYELLDILLHNRFVILKGTIGIGKSSLVKELSNKMMDRRIFADGIIYIDAKIDTNIERAVSILTGDQAINKIIRRNSGNKEFDLQQSIREIVAALSEYEVLIIFDNIDNLCSKSSSHLRTFFDGLITNTTKVKVLTTLFSKVETIQAGFSERVYEIGKLSEAASAQLLLKRSTRRIYDQEIAQLYIDHPHFHSDEKEKPTLENHFLMELFGGLPSALLMGASILHNRTLSELCLLLSNKNSQLKLQPLILEAGNHPLVENSVGLALEIVQDLEELDNLKLMSFFPSGIEEADLKVIWGTDYSYHLNNLMNISVIHKHKANEDNTYYTINCFLLNQLSKFISNEELGEYLGKLIGLFLKKMENYYSTIGTFGVQKHLVQFNFEEGNIKYFYSKLCDFYGRNTTEDGPGEVGVTRKKQQSSTLNKLGSVAKNVSNSGSH